ncbi:hypothetical protein L6R46_07960 [Myxococcota bacterium]|nr:hypothetical protein [Myxococcota bacterium]
MGDLLSPLAQELVGLGLVHGAAREAVLILDGVIGHGQGRAGAVGQEAVAVQIRGVEDAVLPDGRFGLAADELDGGAEARGEAGGQERLVLPRFAQAEPAVLVHAAPGGAGVHEALGEQDLDAEAEVGERVDERGPGVTFGAEPGLGEGGVSHPAL